MITKQLPLFESALNCFGDELFGYVMREEIKLGEEREDIEYFLEFLQYPDSPYFIEKEKLKIAIIEAFSGDDDYWISLNDTPIEDGYHITAAELWWGTFPDDDPCDPDYYRDDEYKNYHFVMLKFMVKKLIWDTLWPEEGIPNYQEPENGLLPIKSE
jgi:hypothetical protein